MKVRSLPEHLQKKAQAELNEVPSRIEEDIKHIREWITKQPHLSIRTDDQHLLTFLRGCKFSLQKTKEKLDFFYSMRTIVPELFGGRDPDLPEIQQIFKTGAVVMLPQNAKSLAPAIVMLRWGACNVETMSVLNILKAILMTIDVAMNDNDNLIVSGIIFVSDFTNFPVKYALQFTPAIVKKFILCIEKAYPIRIKSAYNINVIPIFDTLFSISKPFMSEKFKNRMHVFKEDEIDKFYADISQPALPKEYGGEQPSVSIIADQLNHKMRSYKKWFLEDNQYCSNEKLRSGASSSIISGILNMEGSFRKLNID